MQPRPVVASGYAPYAGQAPRPAMAPMTYTSAPGQAGYGQPVYTQPRVGMVAPSSTTMLRPGAPARPAYTHPQVPQPMPTGAYMQGQPMPAYTTRPVVAGAPYQQPVQALSSRAAPAQKNVTAGPAYTVAAYEEKHNDDAQLQNLKELRRTSGLKNVPVGDGLSLLKAAAIDGQLTREQFVRTYDELLTQHGIAVPEAQVKNAVFDLFDRDDNHVVDMMELICGISLLCSGSEEDKIHAVFNVFDENGDGYISMDEMFKFLTSVFKVVLTPQVMAVMNTMGVTVESAEDLASVTALECYKTADLNHDGRLSINEFKNWFYAPRNDPSFLFSPVRKLLQ